MSCERIKAIANSYLFSESERAQSWYACTNTPLPRILWSVLSRLAPLKHSLCLTPGKVCGKDLQTHTIPPPACWGAERSWKPSTVNSKEILQVLSWRCCRGREKGTGKKKCIVGAAGYFFSNLESVLWGVFVQLKSNNLKQNSSPSILKPQDHNSPFFPIRKSTSYFLSQSFILFFSSWLYTDLKPFLHSLHWCIQGYS